MPTATDGEGEAVTACKVDAGDDVVGVLATDDERWAAVVHGVPDASGIVIGRIVRQDYGA